MTEKEYEITLLYVQMPGCPHAEYKYNWDGLPENVWKQIRSHDNPHWAFCKSIIEAIDKMIERRTGA